MARITCCLAMLALLLGGPVAAQAPPPVPMQISYQGYLTSSTNQPVTAPTTLTLRLYAAPTGGDAVWQETHANVAVTNGVFQVMLGSVTPLTVTVFDTARFLSVQAGTDAEMNPRQVLGASPFAIQAQVANQLAAGATVAGSQITGALSGATVPGSQVRGAITDATISGATLTQLQGQLAPTAQPPQATSLTTVDATGSVGYNPSLTIGADGLPVIAYYDGTNGHLKVAKCSNVFCAPYFRRP